MSAPDSVVIGIGNEFRRDDGIGPAVAAQVAGLPGVRALTCSAEPAALLDAWTGVALAVLVDAADGGVPGRIRRCAIGELTDPRPVSSHDLSIRQTYELGLVLGRAPDELVVVTVDVADTGYGPGLSPAVAAVLPHAVNLVRCIVGTELEKAANS